MLWGGKNPPPRLQHFLVAYQADGFIGLSLLEASTRADICSITPNICCRSQTGGAGSVAIGGPVQATAPSHELQAPKRPIPTTTLVLVLELELRRIVYSQNGTIDI